MRAFGRLGGGMRDCTGRSRGAGTRSDTAAAVGVCTAAIDHSVNSPAHVVRNVKRAVGADGHAAGTMFGCVR